MSNEKLKNEMVDRLFEAVQSLKNLEEYYAFFEDLCTVNEIKSLAQRLEVAKMLHEGFTYQSIEEKTGASTATISRVKRYLNYGAGGYEIALRRME